jgi:hypothetical protein
MFKLLCEFFFLQEWASLRSIYFFYILMALLIKGSLLSMICWLVIFGFSRFILRLNLCQSNIDKRKVKGGDFG